MSPDDGRGWAGSWRRRPSYQSDLWSGLSRHDVWKRGRDAAAQSWMTEIQRLSSLNSLSRRHWPVRSYSSIVPCRPTNNASACQRPSLTMIMCYEWHFSVNWTFFARCYGWGATSDYRFKIVDFAPTGAGWRKISGTRGRPPQTILLLRKLG